MTAKPCWSPQRRPARSFCFTKTRRIGGFAGELAALISEEAFDYLDGPIRRITAPDTPVPYSPPLEEFFLPKVSDVVRVARELYAY